MTQKQNICKTFKHLGSKPSRKLQKLLADGWTLVEQQQIGMSGVSRYTLTKPNPKFKAPAA